MAKVDDNFFEKLSPEEKIKRLQAMKEEVDSVIREEQDKHKRNIDEIEGLLEEIKDEQELLERVSVPKPKNIDVNELFRRDSGKPGKDKESDRLEGKVLEAPELTEEQKREAEKLSRLPAYRLDQYASNLNREKPAYSASEEEKEKFYDRLSMLKESMYMKQEAIEGAMYNPTQNALEAMDIMKKRLNSFSVSVDQNNQDYKR